MLINGTVYIIMTHPVIINIMETRLMCQSPGTQMTGYGFVINLNDNGTARTLTLKGARKVGAAGNTADNFEDLDGGTIINISTVNGGEQQALDIVTP